LMASWALGASLFVAPFSPLADSALAPSIEAVTSAVTVPFLSVCVDQMIVLSAMPVRPDSRV
jgi:hypothetical protein